MRFCVANTDSSDATNPGEVICIVDETPLGAKAWRDERTGFSYQSHSDAKPLVAAAFRLVEVRDRFNSVDKLDYNRRIGQLCVVEDDTYGEIWVCLPDGHKDNYQSDGCVPMLSVVDPQAEPTGFMFDDIGLVAFLHIQHGGCPDALKDFKSNPDGGCIDDLLKITGFKRRISNGFVVVVECA